MRRILILASVAAVAGGCGDGPQARTTATPTPARAAAPATRAAAPVLVFFQRQGAAGATLDTFTVRRDGSARLEKRYGGAGGRFKDLALRAGQLPRLKAALARLPHTDTLTSGSPPRGGAHYILRYHGRTQTALEGGVVPAARPAVRLLDGYIDGIGVRPPTHETATNSP